jgi:glycosyltransferase involved in cell wall biosynthesis
VSGPEVAVVIPAYDEADAIGACLDTLAAQTLPHELVVVDDGSTDATAAIAEARGARVLREGHRGPAVARNRGAAETTAPILAFLDADMTFAPDFLERLVEPIRSGGAIGTFTRDELLENVDNRWARYTNLFTGLPADRRMPADHGDESRVFRAIRRDAFERAGGYDDTGPGEDVTLSAKLGVPATRAEGALCWHRNPARLSEVFAAARWYGKSDMTPHTAANWLRLAPPVAALRAVRAGLRHRSAPFALFAFVHDLGAFAGFVDRDLLGRHHAR